MADDYDTARDIMDDVFGPGTYAAMNRHHPDPGVQAAIKRGIPKRGGWWNMMCWNGLSEAQQRRLIERGTLEFGYEPEGECQRGAAVAIECEGDLAPGPRFYCVPCAIQYLQGMDT